MKQRNAKNEVHVFLLGEMCTFSFYMQKDAKRLTTCMAIHK